MNKSATLLAVYEQVGWVEQVVCRIAVHQQGGYTHGTWTGCHRRCHSHSCQSYCHCSLRPYSTLKQSALASDMASVWDRWNLLQSHSRFCAETVCTSDMASCQISESYCSLRPDSALETKPTSLRHTWPRSVWDKRELLQSHSGFSSETEPPTIRHIMPMLLQYHYRLSFETEHVSLRHIWTMLLQYHLTDAALKQSTQALDICDQCLRQAGVAAVFVQILS